MARAAFLSIEGSAMSSQLQLAKRTIAIQQQRMTSLRHEKDAVVNENIELQLTIAELKREVERLSEFVSSTPRSLQ